ncbi:hypothetical protein HMPREF0765_3605 [Sphingobacterium spiritivorum ATCC 33300]|uniref:MORN repeat protein n=2 Tax=Sphingobacterium spiritivorum TaxID=258 RepID=C2G1Z9_SPHSI|nr:hypothetical protein [Sphingobacterium spiritivorum]EEI90689.1 hypothetical protein HMPREF0765_3605 [Sphingobacterium spiritivorum ATCC 33300]QQS95636.1 hypothetical protein I6J03_20030 [Sphingobacterium spiritivorum]
MKYNIININFPKYISLLGFMFTAIITESAYAQTTIDTLKIKAAHIERAYIDEISIIGISGQKPVALKDGSYRLESKNQTADITLKNGLINGSVSETDGKVKNNYTIVNSLIMTYNSSTGSIPTVDTYRKEKNMFFKQYENSILRTEGWVSLDKNKHYGRGVSKSYHRNGNIRHISDEVSETYTDFYPNGNKQRVSAVDRYEAYDEDGRLTNKQYRKNNVRYSDDYVEGKLYMRTYENSEKNEVKEYYKNAILQKKEVIKTINGIQRLLTYNKAGKLISNERYLPANEILLYEEKRPSGQ